MPSVLKHITVLRALRSRAQWSALLAQNMYASAPKSTVGTVAYIAPEVLTCKRDHTKYKVHRP